MKIILIILLLFIHIASSYAQKSASQEIKDAIAFNFNKWLVKSDFETNADYEKRVKNKSDERLKSITDSVMQSVKSKYLRGFLGYLGRYDAENETYLIMTDYKDSFTVKIPRTIAPEIKEGLKSDGWDNRIRIRVFPSDVTIINDKWTITEAYIIFCVRCDHDYDQRCLLYANPLTITLKNGNLLANCGYQDFKIFKIEDFKKFAKSDNLPDGAYYCKWNISDQPNYNPSSTKPISFSLEDLNITLPTISTNTQTASTTKIQVPDLDMNSIQTKNKNSNAFAVVIGNRDYQSTKKVSYAINDAQTIKKYLINVLGYNEGNIFYLENASKSNFETYFGTKENPQGKLYNNIKQGISDVFIYYAGHGAPGLKDNKGYFVPIDCDPQYVEQGGYSLDLFYNNISKLNAKSITVVMDACFSGAEIFNNISPIIITISNPIAVADNCVVLSSSTGSQVSSWYNDKQHGMFTYFFLKALQDKDKSDKNKDGKLSFQEIFDYVSDKTEGVPYYARSIHGVDQTPAIQGTGVNNIFIEYK